MASQNRELKKAGLKVTAPRLKILAMLSDASEQGDHLSAEELYQRLRDTGEDIGLATVYRVLTQFETAELIIRHNFEAGYSVFEMAPDHHHDHMVDVDTNEVIEFIDEEIERRQHLIAEQHATRLSITLWCCASARKTGPNCSPTSRGRAPACCRSVLRRRAYAPPPQCETRHPAESARSARHPHRFWSPAGADDLSQQPGADA